MDTNTSTSTSTKPWWQSRTILGAIVSGGVAIAAIFNVEIADLSESFLDGLMGIGVLVGTSLTVYGRFTAEKELR